MSRGYWSFIKEFSRSFAEVGSLLPSSPALSKILARPVGKAKRPINILEVGPGTGPVTKQILKLMGEKDHFVVCEINKNFVKILKKNLEKNKNYLKHRERVEIVQAPVQNLNVQDYQGKFDVIISSLPFANFPPELVKEILDCYQEMITEKGQILFFQYIGMKKIAAIFGSKSKKIRVKAVQDVINRWCSSKDAVVEKEVTLLNIPPACAYKFTANAGHK